MAPTGFKTVVAAGGGEWGWRNRHVSCENIQPKTLTPTTKREPNLKKRLQQRPFKSTKRGCKNTLPFAVPTRNTVPAVKSNHPRPVGVVRPGVLRRERHGQRAGVRGFRQSEINHKLLRKAGVFGRPARETPEVRSEKPEVIGDVKLNKDNNNKDKQEWNNFKIFNGSPHQI